MTKTERLLFILNIFRVRKAAKIEELADECNVSKRTIYRDLQALLAMDIPIYCNDGYNLVEEISLPPLKFTRAEQEILGYSLRTTRLRRSSRLDKIIRNIELKIIAAIPHIKRERLCELIVDQDRHSKRFTSEIDDIVGVCLKALMNGRRLKLRMCSGVEKWPFVKPISLQIGDKRWRLTAVDKTSGKIFEVWLEDIEQAEIATGR